MTTQNISASSIAGAGSRVDRVAITKSSVSVVTMFMAGDFVFSGDRALTGASADIHSGFGTGKLSASGVSERFYPGNALPGAVPDTVRHKAVCPGASEENPGSEALQQPVEDAIAEDEGSRPTLCAAAGKPEVHGLNKGPNLTAPVSQMAARSGFIPAFGTESSGTPGEHESGPCPSWSGFTDDVPLPHAGMPHVEPDDLQPGITKLPNLTYRSKSPDAGSGPDFPLYSASSHGSDIRASEACLMSGSQCDPNIGVQGCPVEFLAARADDFDSADESCRGYLADFYGSLEGFALIKDESGGGTHKIPPLLTFSPVLPGRAVFEKLNPGG